MRTDVRRRLCVIAASVCREGEFIPRLSVGSINFTISLLRLYLGIRYECGRASTINLFV